MVKLCKLFTCRSCLCLAFPSSFFTNILLGFSQKYSFLCDLSTVLLIFMLDFERGALEAKSPGLTCQNLVSILHSFQLFSTVKFGGFTGYLVSF